jgi:hypothetical protein
MNTQIVDAIVEEMSITLNSIQPTLHELKLGLKALYGDRLARMSLNHSFDEVFYELTKYTTKNEAFDIVTRANVIRRSLLMILE